MLQINAAGTRAGWTGAELSWTDIETSFKSMTWKDGIISGLENAYLNETRDDRRRFWEWCKQGAEEWLTAKPDVLERVTEKVDSEYKELLKENDYELRNQVKAIYDYKHEKLIDLAEWLNVKTCPYCNMQYMLFMKGQTKKKTMAKFQFDHFYSRADYPMLSMSLYNLIPSCASCNQGKSAGKLSLQFHPYYAAIKDAFRFEVEDPVVLWEGNDSEVPEIAMVANEGYDLADYERMFHVQKLYQHHKDVARETFARAYADTYYNESDNFAFLTDRDLKERMLMGGYPDEKDIDKRPLTKLRQDLWKQAKGIWG